MSDRPLPLGRSDHRAGAPLELPRPPGALLRFWQRHPRLVDALLAGVFLVVDVFGLFSVFLATGATRPTWLVAVLVMGSAVTAAAVLVRRHRPWLTFAVAWATAIIALVLDGGLYPVWIAVALYSVAVYASTRSAWLGFGWSAAASVGCVALSTQLSAGTAGSVGSTAIVNPFFILITLIATLIGVNAGSRRRYVTALVDRAEQLARERDQQARLATIIERARITREMHDIVAHSLSIMVSLSDGAAAIAEKDPARSRAAMQDISEIGRRSLNEMRRLLGARGADGDESDVDHPSPLHPQPVIADLDELLATFRSAGLPVELVTSGEPPTAAGVQTAIYRVVQESLTNALRYADGARRVTVQLDYRDGGVDAAVTDDGAGAQTEPSAGSGRGLIGIRERALLYGGTMTAGPQPTGGWRVHVSMPQAGDDT